MRSMFHIHNHLRRRQKDDRIEKMAEKELFKGSEKKELESAKKYSGKKRDYTEL